MALLAGMLGDILGDAVVLAAVLLSALGELLTILQLQAFGQEIARVLGEGVYL